MTMRLGLIGCGNISDIYLINAARFRDIKFVACADLNPDAASRQGEKYSIEARTVKRLLASEDVDIILNLTVPAAHAEVSLKAIENGKHVYSEKPLATTINDGKALLAAAKARKLRVGGAPDTVLGASIQEARRLIDANAIGTPLSGLASVLSHGMEHWHPNPGFFFKPGGGPVFDMGPYYLTTLVTLLGPVASLQASGKIGFAKRIVTTPGSSMLGKAIKVETLTDVHAMLEFKSGARVTLLASWDVWRHSVQPIELHGEKASLRVPDPNWFGGDLHLAEGRAEWKTLETNTRSFGIANWPKDKPIHANYRGLGLADMARAIKDKRPHRANGDLALHVLHIMAGILEGADKGRKVTIRHAVAAPAYLGEEEAKGLLAEAK